MTSSIKDKALFFLARREHSYYELKRKLEVNAGSVEVTAVLDDLAMDDLQSDERFAVSRVRHRAQQGYGPRYCASELMQHRIDSGVADACLAEILWADVWQRCQHKCSHATGSAAWCRFWQRRGFSLTDLKKWQNKD